MADDDDGVDALPGDGGEDEARGAALGNRTMQVDALVEELEDGAMVPDDALAQVLADAAAAGPKTSMPPPLPPKKVSTGTIVIGLVVVVLAAGGGIFFGMKFMGEPEPTAVQQPTPEASGAAEPDELVDEEEEPIELEAVPIQLDEVAIPHPDDELLEEGPELEDEEE